MRETVKRRSESSQKLFISDDAACRAEIGAIARWLNAGARRAALRRGLRRKEAREKPGRFQRPRAPRAAALPRGNAGRLPPHGDNAGGRRAVRQVMTDEYQDTNDAQDYLFRAVSKDNGNRFMVGDVKQSIYSFRQAMPDIFIGYKDAFPRYDRGADTYPRPSCSTATSAPAKNVTESVNFVFSQLMSRACGGVDYTGGEALAAGADYPEKRGCETRVEFIDDIDGLGAEVLEPQRIAEMIRAMMGRASP